MSKALKFALARALSLAALVGLLGCEPYARPPYQAWGYSGPPYPAPPAWGPQSPAPLPPGARGAMPLQDVEARVFRFTNDVRQQYGLPPLAWEGTLSGVSQAYCDDMLQRRFFSHTNPEGKTAGDRLKACYSGPISGWGENIWEGSNISTADREALARRILNGWMSSSGHRENILGPKFTHLGVGVSAGGREITATQLFAILR